MANGLSTSNLAGSTRSKAPVRALPREAEPSVMHARLDLEVLRAQVAMVYGRSRISNLVGIPFGLLVCWLLDGTTSRVMLAGWYATKFLTTFWRFALDRLRAAAPDSDPATWLRRMQVALFFDGLVFGALAWLPGARDELIVVLMLATVVGGASVAFVVFSHHFRTMLAIVTPMLAQELVYHFWLGTHASLYCGFGSLTFLCLCINDGRHSSRHTEDMLRVRFQMDELAVQRERALASAEHDSAVKSQFLATMSHEMRTPLNGMLGLLQILEQQPRDREEHERLGLMRRSGQHLAGLINEILDFARIGSGRVELRGEPFELRTLVNEIAELLGPEARSKGIRIDLTFALPDPCWLDGDGPRIRQILNNLIGNACKFTDRGEVRIEVAHHESRLTVTVRDSGIGIPAADVPRLFTPFFQVDGSFARRHGGTGLGLAISRELARAMGGDVRLVSTGAHGTTFCFEATVAASLPPAVTATVAATNGTAWLRARVLVVEDNAVNALVARLMLEKFGAEVEIAADGAAALSSYSSRRPDLILMDCQMPLMDGFEATRRIREVEQALGHPRLPIVAFTANAMEGDRSRSLEAGMDDHLAKPVEIDELEGMIQRWLPDHIARQAEVA